MTKTVNTEAAASDIVERLRAGEACSEISAEYACAVKNAASGCQCAEAADEIERLRALYDEAMTCWKQTTEQCQIAVDQATTIRAETLEEAARKVPTTWLDPLLNGPGATKLPLDVPGVEKLCRGIAAAIRALKGKQE